MRFQGWIFATVMTVATMATVGCSHSTIKQSEETAPAKVASETTGTPLPAAVLAPESATRAEPVAKKVENGFLICKAKKSRFHYDWNASSLASGQNNQNSVRFEFRSAKRPAGSKGENLKAGECGWADDTLAGNKKMKSQVTFKSLSDEVTQNFYKLKTGKVFKVPVRQTQNGMMAAPGTGISVVR